MDEVTSSLSRTEFVWSWLFLSSEFGSDVYLWVRLGYFLTTQYRWRLNLSIMPISCGVSTNGQVPVCAERAPQLEGSPGEDYWHDVVEYKSSESQLSWWDVLERWILGAKNNSNKGGTWRCVVSVSQHSPLHSSATVSRNLCHVDVSWAGVKIRLHRLFRCLLVCCVCIRS